MRLLLLNFHYTLVLWARLFKFSKSWFWQVFKWWLLSFSSYVPRYVFSKLFFTFFFLSVSICNRNLLHITCCWIMSESLCFLISQQRKVYLLVAITACSILSMFVFSRRMQVYNLNPLKEFDSFQKQCLQAASQQPRAENIRTNSSSIVFTIRTCKHNHRTRLEIILMTWFKGIENQVGGYLVDLVCAKLALTFIFHFEIWRFLTVLFILLFPWQYFLKRIGSESWLNVFYISKISLLLRFQILVEMVNILIATSLFCRRLILKKNLLFKI